jgi:large subunit ribosomal protein L7/L12
MSIKTIEILEQLKTLSALETNELVKQIEVTFDVTALARVMPFRDYIPHFTDEEIEIESEFDVVVESVSADKKISVLKEVRVITGLGLKEAKDFVDTLPQKIKSGIAKTEAEKIKKQLEEAGASISIL